MPTWSDYRGGMHGEAGQIRATVFDVGRILETYVDQSRRWCDTYCPDWGPTEEQELFMDSFNFDHNAYGYKEALGHMMELLGGGAGNLYRYFPYDESLLPIGANSPVENEIVRVGA